MNAPSMPRHYAGHAGMTRVESRLDRQQLRTPTERDSMTAVLMGDPPVGLRALDRPRQAIASTPEGSGVADSDDGRCRAVGCTSKRMGRKANYCEAHHARFCIAMEPPRRAPRMITRGWGK